MNARLLSLVFCCFLVVSGANTAGAVEAPSPCMRIAVPSEEHVDAPTVRRIMTELYAEAGICLQLIDASLTRSEKGLLLGAYDGEAMRYSGYLSSHPNIVAVSTPMLSAEIYWMALDVDAVPKNANLDELVTGRPVAVPSRFALFAGLTHKLRISPVRYEKPGQLVALLDSHRVLYGLMIEGGLEALSRRDLDRLDIRTFRTIAFQHVIRREQEWALPKLEEAAKRLQAAGRLQRFPDDREP